MAKQTFMARVKAYRKLHPRTSQVDAMKKLAGTKPKKVGAKPKKKTTVKITKRVPASGNKRGNSTGPSTVHTGTLTISGRKKNSSASPISKGISISRKIEDLTVLLKNTSGIEAKNKIKRLINSEHDKLDAITKNLKSA